MKRNTFRKCCNNVKKWNTWLMVLCVFLFVLGCDVDTDFSSYEEYEENEAVEIYTENDPEINSEKGMTESDPLMGTPFDGMEIGDDIGWSQLRSAEYLTYSVDSLPILVYPIFFNESEKEEIKEGIEIANDAIGFDVFELADRWSDDVRVIYKVDSIEDDDADIDEGLSMGASAIALTSLIHFEDKEHAAVVVCDWQIELKEEGVDKLTVAHELGHAMGIAHSFIDYDNDALVELEEDSIMSAGPFSDNPAMDDYYEMMETQGEILKKHLGEGSAPDARSMYLH